MPWNVESVMTRNPKVVEIWVPYKEMVTIIEQDRISALPVVDSERRVIGIVSESDLMLRTLAGEGRVELTERDRSRLEGRNARAIMTAPVITTRPAASLSEAGRLMHDHAVKRLPVVDDEDRIVGIVSRSDLLRPFLQDDDTLRDLIRQHVIVDTLALDPRDVEVTVGAGVVMLHGEIATRSLARIVERMIADLQGVVGVDSELTWRHDDTTRPVIRPL